MSINDYNWISYFDKTKGYVVNLDTNYVKELANESFDKLNKYLNETDKKTIIMTHFPPLRSGTSDPKYYAEEKKADNYDIFKIVENYNFEIISTQKSSFSYMINKYKTNILGILGILGIPDNLKKYIETFITDYPDLSIGTSKLLTNNQQLKIIQMKRIYLVFSQKIKISLFFHNLIF